MERVGGNSPETDLDLSMMLERCAPRQGSLQPPDDNAEEGSPRSLTLAMLLGGGGGSSAAAPTLQPPRGLSAAAPQTARCILPSFDNCTFDPLPCVPTRITHDPSRRCASVTPPSQHLSISAIDSDEVVATAPAVPAEAAAPHPSTPEAARTRYLEEKLALAEREARVLRARVEAAPSPLPRTVVISSPAQDARIRELEDRLAKAEHEADALRARTHMLRSSSAAAAVEEDVAASVQQPRAGEHEGDCAASAVPLPDLSFQTSPMCIRELSVTEPCGVLAGGRDVSPPVARAQRARVRVGGTHPSPPARGVVVAEFDVPIAVYQRAQLYQRAAPSTLTTAAASGRTLVNAP